MRPKGSLTAEQQQHVINWLRSKIHGEFRCVVCDAQQWSVQDHLAAPFTSPAGGGFATDAIYPYAQLLCTNCGNTHFINAFHIGLVKKTEGAGA